MTTLEVPKRHYTAEEVEEALVAIAFHRSSRKASAAIGIPASTLQDWMHIHAERLAKIKADLSEQMAQSHDAIVHRLAQEQHATLDVFAKKRDELKAADAASAIRNFAVAQGVHEDKALTHRGQPTQITEHRTADTTLDGMRRKYPGMFVDSTAEDITDAEVVPIPTPSQPHGVLAPRAEADDQRAQDQEPATPEPSSTPS